MKRSSILIIFLFLLIYSSISLVNHYLFRSHAWDLGLETNAAFDYAHLRWNDCTLIQPPFTNFLSDHFSLILIFISPVIYLLGTYGLLIVQITFILWGGIGIYKYVFYKSNSLFKANLFLIHFYGFFGIFSALGFDFHNNVIGAMFVPWIFYYSESNKIKSAGACFILLLISKENMALWGAFIATGLLMIYYKDLAKRKALILLTAFSLIYFIMVAQFIMPSLANAGRGYGHLWYHALGNDYSEILRTIIFKPRYVFALLFEPSQPSSPDQFGVKSELHFLILLSGGYALLRKPTFLWMLIPIYGQKLFNDLAGIWGVGCQYSIEFAPILSIALFEFFQIYKINTLLIKWLLIVGLLLSLSATISSIETQVTIYYSSLKTRFYDYERYRVDFNVKEVNQELDNIPDSAKVSASTCLVPHLCLRNFIYQYPVVNDADYILIFLDENPYPLNRDQRKERVVQLEKDSLWAKTYDKNKLLIFKRKM